MCLGFWSSCIKITLFLKKSTFFQDFQNAVNFQPIGEFWCPTPEKKARGALASFLAFKSQNKSRIYVLFWDENHEMYWSANKYVLFYHKCSSPNKLEILLLFYDLNTGNGTYASLAFISGVGHKNSPSDCKITAFWKSLKKWGFF